MFYREIEQMVFFDLQREFFNCAAIDSLALGGSRARGEYNENSDYDLFCIVYQDLFDDFRNSFIDFLMNDCNMVIAAEEFYLENWGYLFKAFDDNTHIFDISIIPDNRINELGIKKSNIVLFDKSGLFLQHVDCCFDYSLFSKQQNTNLRKNTINKVIIDLVYINRIIKRIEYDYWEGVKYLERIRRNVMILMRMNKNLLNRKFFSPEKNFSAEINDYDLRKLYNIKKIDNHLYNTWKEFFLSLCTNNEKEYVNNKFSTLLFEEKNECFVD